MPGVHNFLSDKARLVQFSNYYLYSLTLGCFFKEPENIPTSPDLDNTSEGKEENRGAPAKTGAPFYLLSMVPRPRSAAFFAVSDLLCGPFVSEALLAEADRSKDIYITCARARISPTLAIRYLFHSCSTLSSSPYPFHLSQKKPLH